MSAPVSNQFGQTTVKGVVDLRMGGNVMSVEIGAAQETALTAGMPVKLATTAGGIPKVLLADADDEIFGFVCYDTRRAEMAAGEIIEIAFFRGAVMYMEASAAIVRGVQVMHVVTGVKVATAAVGTKRIIGIALDTAAADGDLVRVLIDVPGALTAAS